MWSLRRAGVLPFPDLPTRPDGTYALRDDEMLGILLCLLSDDEFNAAAQKHEKLEVRPAIDTDTIAGRMEREWQEKRSREIAAAAAAERSGGGSGA